MSAHKYVIMSVQYHVEHIKNNKLFKKVNMCGLMHRLAYAGQIGQTFIIIIIILHLLKLAHKKH